MANTNQSIDEVVAYQLAFLWFTLVISSNSHTLKASTKPKQLRKQKNLLFLFLMQGLKKGKWPLISQRGGGGGGGGVY